MEVTRDDLERSIERLASETSDRLAGIHGPSTLAWEHGREVANFIGAGRAVLMQLAHPPVAAAIAEHSKTFSDLRGRFERTFAIVFAMTFGDLDAAIASARRLHRVHVRIRGTLENGAAYAANSRESLRWVYATLIDSVFAVRRFCGEPLSPADCEIYYRETKRFALLFGLEANDLPVSYRDFCRYLAESVDGRLTRVSPVAKQMGIALLAAPHRLLAPASRSFRLITAALLPGQLADGFGLAPTPSRERRTKRRARLLFLGFQSSPEQVRFFPNYLDALARLGLRSGRARRIDRLGQLGLELVSQRARASSDR